MRICTETSLRYKEEVKKMNPESNTNQLIEKLAIQKGRRDALFLQMKDINLALIAIEQEIKLLDLEIELIEAAIQRTYWLD